MQELTRKDNLIKNLKRMKRSLQRDGNSDEAQKYDFWPQTYVLPGDYALFAEEGGEFDSSLSAPARSSSVSASSHATFANRSCTDA